MNVLEAMKVFSAVAAEGSFTRGSERAGVSVQTASKTIKALEERLGAQLFDRNTRSVALNNTGQAYLERCDSLLAEFDELESSIQTEHRDLKGPIRLSAPTAFGERYLVDALCSFLDANPNISVDLSLNNRRVALIEEGFDLALRIGDPRDSSLVARRLAPMRVVVCATPEYLRQHGTPQVPEDLRAHCCVLDNNFGTERQWPFLRDGELLRVPIDGPLTVNSPAATRRFALSGLGLAMCPMYVVGPDLVAGRLQLVLEQYEAYDFGVYALYPHRRHLSARVRALVDHLATNLRQL